MCRWILAIGITFVGVVLIAKPQEEGTVLMRLLRFSSGQDLHERCRHTGEEYFPAGASQQDKLQIQSDVGYCDGFIAGVTETVDLKWWDPPVPLKHDQLMAVVKKYIEAHPEEWDQPGSALVRKALIRAFPPEPKGD